MEVLLKVLSRKLCGLVSAEKKMKKIAAWPGRR